MHIMLVDDSASNRELGRIILSKIADEISICSDGDDVINTIEKMTSIPDIILLDVLMPKKDGFTTAVEIRNTFPDYHIPIIFLTSLDDHASFEKCLTFGDDFILKPFDSSVIKAKVFAHHRIVKMHNEVKAQRDELRQFHDHIRYEHAIAESIFNNLKEDMNAYFGCISGIEYVSTPSTLFNGDLIVAAKGPHGSIYVLIADATGHGLPAAILTIPAYRAFFTMATKGIALGDVVTELNNVMSSFLPVGMMLAASIFEIRPNGTELCWWGGGLPDGYIIDPDGSIVDKLISTHMPLGVLKPHEFESDLIHLTLQPGQKILCYTDGVIEATDSCNTPYGRQRLEQSISNNNASITALYDAVSQHSDKRMNDDLSILTMAFPVTNKCNHQYEADINTDNQVPCSYTQVFSADVLKNITVMNEVRNLLSGLIKGIHLDFICSVLSELFANAIEHGLLNLDSSIKEQEDGFYTFYKLREEQIKKLSNHYWINLEVDYQPGDKKIVLTVEHNGEGFDYENFMSSSISPDPLLYGQGIALVTRLCESVHYSNKGKCVTAIYRLEAHE
ncbi:ATP-binding SpoIIE family protein phosphatase [Vibrio salinus]|uniref:ATP-binding SpoIIE family protein phosphatase n=1 Tax=Vibrio salinus TaxID=2899784 RepID=UPI001E287478|nr:fused response regulator/phosphatase [Vibrio salinus]MCE0495275.1 fused response regulator/phosphatase [Vibrio salinus]